MGKSLIFWVLGTMTIVSIITLNLNNSLNDSLEMSIDHYSEIQARFITNSIVNMMLTELSDSTTLRYTSTQTKSLFNGSANYTVKDTILASDSLVQIKVTANYLDRTKTTLVYVEIPSGDVVSLPPFLEYAILGGQEVKLNGDKIKVRHAQHPTFNTDVHSNDKVTLNGSNMTFEGFVTYTNSYTQNGSNFNINPIENPDSLPVHHQKNPITIPTFNASDYLAAADVVYNSDQTLSGNINLGTAANPKIIYVKGKLQISGKVYGYGVFIAEDDVEIKGDLTSNSPDPNYSKVGIFTEKKMILNDEKTTLHSTVYANEEIVINGKMADIWGGVISKSKVTLNNEKITLYYKPLSTDVAGGFWELETTGGFSGRLQALHYYE